MAGLGSASFGAFPFGLGTPVEAAIPPTGFPGSRYINPGSGDYEVDADSGQLAQMPGTRQRVLLALKTLKGSSSVLPEFGILLPRKIDQAIDLRVRDAVRVALSHLTDVDKVIRIESVLVSRRTTGRLAVTLAYTDLSTGAAAEPLTI